MREVDLFSPVHSIPKDFHFVQPWKSIAPGKMLPSLSLQIAALDASEEFIQRIFDWDNTKQLNILSLKKTWPRTFLVRSPDCLFGIAF